MVPSESPAADHQIRSRGRRFATKSRDASGKGVRASIASAASSSRMKTRSSWWTSHSRRQRGSGSIARSRRPLPEKLHHELGPEAIGGFQDRHSCLGDVEVIHLARPEPPPSVSGHSSRARCGRRGRGQGGPTLASPRARGASEGARPGAGLEAGRGIRSRGRLARARGASGIRSRGSRRRDQER